MAMGVLGPHVKILFTYDIIPQTAEDYYEFMLGEMVPAVERMGLTMACRHSAVLHSSSLSRGSRWAGSATMQAWPVKRLIRTS